MSNASTRWPIVTLPRGGVQPHNAVASGDSRRDQQPRKWRSRCQCWGFREDPRASAAVEGASSCAILVAQGEERCQRFTGRCELCEYRCPEPTEPRHRTTPVASAQDVHGFILAGARDGHHARNGRTCAGEEHGKLCPQPFVAEPCASELKAKRPQRKALPAQLVAAVLDVQRQDHLVHRVVADAPDHSRSERDLQHGGG
mmetsp:Transcript_95283/g.269340  ORF Transcript_95283/g.269340 Transcript_95283/m.269340 type:complete len:200 (+) Transcript_95283:92-691(+)